MGQVVNFKIENNNFGLLLHIKKNGVQSFMGEERCLENLRLHKVTLFKIAP